MREIVASYLPWLLSAITATQMYLAGNTHRLTWVIGLVNQALWLVWILAVSAWGLLPLTGILTVVYIRNHLKWGAR